MPKVVVVGVGNRLFGDDGVGSLVAEILEACVKSEDVDVLVRETLDISIIHVLEDYDIVVFVDAIRKSGVEKPELYYVDLDATSQELSLKVVDPHNIDIVRLTLLAHISGKLKAKVYLLGIPVEILELGAPLSKKALNAIPLAMKIVEKVLREKIGLKDPLNVNCINAHLRSLGESL